MYQTASWNMLINNIKLCTYTIQSFNVDPIPLLDNTVDQTLFTFIFSNKKFNLTKIQTSTPQNALHSIKVKVKVEGRTLVIAPLCRQAPPQRRSGTHTYLPYTFPAIAGTHLLTPKGWRVE